MQRSLAGSTIWQAACTKALSRREPGGDRVPVGQGRQACCWDDRRTRIAISPVLGGIANVLATAGDKASEKDYDGNF